MMRTAARNERPFSIFTVDVSDALHTIIQSGSEQFRPTQWSLAVKITIDLVNVPLLMSDGDVQNLQRFIQKTVAESVHCKDEPFDPMQKAQHIEENLQRISAEHGVPIDLLRDKEVWINNLYTVHVSRDDDGAVRHLSVRRNDRSSYHDWRHLFLIKCQIAGENVEAVELYPATSRLVDQSNQFHLWCLPPNEQLPVGYKKRDVEDCAGGTTMHTQRPFDKAYKLAIGEVK